ncbi:hypothetical protein ACFVYP_02590 [Kitasatospora sp. NPDC058201]|uniref:hypothetical protein n=1 Tax=unclassified Kitasatospora TaxID=2633591 RepID=UPI00365212D5
MPRMKSNPAYRPQIGEIVRDLAKRGLGGEPVEGVCMDCLAGLYYLRSEQGGCEWTTRPESVRRLDAPRFVNVQHPSPPRSVAPIGEVT